MEPGRVIGELGWKILGIIITTMIVASLGALLGWAADNALLGAIMGGFIGLFGAVRSGHVMEEPNVHRPPGS